ncbi:MAG: hypothetical protein AAGD10_05615 [Myxococcota bacterium]
MLALWLALLAGAEPSLVSVRTTRGAIDGPHLGALAEPRWDRLQLRVEIENRLPVAVTDLELGIELLRDETPIPGWAFSIELAEPFLPDSLREVEIDESLLDRRGAVRADELRYRVELRRYRMTPPRLDVALEALGSSFDADQRAALVSFDAGLLGARERLTAIEDVERVLVSPPASPSAKDALALLTALRALGRLQAAGHVDGLLTLEDQLDPDAWGRAVMRLAERMLDVSPRDGARLEVLPRWARERSGLLRVRASDAVREAIRDAVLTMGDAAIPPLVRALHGPGRSASVRERAWQLLVSLGRPTVSSQLRVSRLQTRLEVIEAFGELGLADAAPRLVELVRVSGGRVGRAARRALGALGPAGLSALEDGLGLDDDRIRDALRELGPAGREAEIRRRSEAAREEQRRAIEARIERALGDPDRDRALRELQSLVDADQLLGHRRPVAERYRDEVSAQLQAGNFDEALRLSRVGRDVEALPAFELLGAEARLALADGLGDLGQWERVQDFLQSDFPQALEARVRRLRERRWEALATEAASLGNRARARLLVEEAKSAGVTSPVLDRLDRRLLLNENLPFLVGGVLSGFAILLALSLWVLRRMESVRMERLQAALDQPD